MMVMINYKIICNDRSIKFINSQAALSFWDETDKIFCKVNNNTIEIKYSSLDDISESEDLSIKYETIIIMLKSVGKDNMKKLNFLLSHNNVIVAMMREEKICNRPNMIKLKTVNEKINVEALISMFSNKEILTMIKSGILEFSMIIGCEKLINSLESILQNILNNIYYIENNKYYNLYLYCNKEFNLQETAELEDLMREYLYNAEEIEIKQVNNSELKNNVFYSILAAK